ncbi:hypothetical protein EYS14_24750 [Alteromonadaceae bacterium M269]|nr:hypothetical protein EYS14_24750 [Alteromonadaceae bacterium M269]
MLTGSLKDKWIRSTFSTNFNSLIKDIDNKRLLVSYKKSKKGKLKFTSNVKMVVKLLRSLSLCRYQAMLLRKYFQYPEKYLRLDCDRLVFTIDCSKKDIDAILKPIGKSKEFRFKRVLANSRLKISNSSVSNINKGWCLSSKEKAKARPYYSHAFQIQVDDSSHKLVYVHIADGSHMGNAKYALRVDMIPQHLTEDDFGSILQHFGNRLGHRRFNQLLRKARLTRIDFGFLLLGVSSLFVQSYRNVKKSIQSSTKPKEKGSVVETVYFNNNKESSHFIVYEKLLKEAKNHSNIENILDTLAVTTRIEYRHYPYRSRETRMLSDMLSVPAPLASIIVISPRHFYLLPTKCIKDMFLYKTHSDTKERVDEIRKVLLQHRKRVKKFKLNQNWLKREQDKLAKKYEQLIFKSYA